MDRGSEKEVERENEKVKEEKKVDFYVDNFHVSRVTTW